MIYLWKPLGSLWEASGKLVGMSRAGQRRECYFLFNRLGQSLHRRDTYRESTRLKVPHWHIFLHSLWTTHHKSAQLSFFIPNEFFFVLIAAGFRVLPQKPPRGSTRGNKPVVVCWFQSNTDKPLQQACLLDVLDDDGVRKYLTNATVELQQEQWKHSLPREISYNAALQTAA